ncbi:OPT oligopeptide transporter protein-domain-containing protein [Lipomyces doorenjongii]|uniref:OPT oligopeptide transporter protein-domain-containing protein n=1 Tax=Lipomyces doorenjongii TaxID=383834 RepID=UPI0034CE9335
MIEALDDRDTWSSSPDEDENLKASEKTAYNINEKQADVAVQSFSEDYKSRVADELREQFRDYMEVGDEKGYDIIFTQTLLMTKERGLEILSRIADYHNDDVNFPDSTMSRIRFLLEGEERCQMDSESYEIAVKVEAALIDSFSPYPEVRAVCDPFDDPDMACETFRAYLLGIIWVGIGSFVNQLFYFRQPPLNLRAAAIQLLLYPCGRFLQTLPDWQFTIRGKRFRFNPGPWSFKEQIFATLMVNVGSYGSNFTNYILIQSLPVYYNESFVTTGYMTLMNLAAGFVGLGLAGILRRWVVYPQKSVWPTVLPTIALSRALLVSEKKTSANGWTMSRYRFFFICFWTMFVYFWIPDYLFSALSTFNWMTWISPKNFKLAVITGSVLGLGFNPITTFDWSVASYSNPLVVPIFATLNGYAGQFIGAFIVLALYWTNYKWAAYLPINSNQLYDRFGVKFNVSKVLTNKLFDEEKYSAYSPPYMSAGNMVYLGSSFLIYTLTFTYVLITEWRVLKDAFLGFFKSLKNRKLSTYAMHSDPMSRMMARYKEVPDWWFLSIFVVSFALFLVGISVYPTNAPVWAMFITIGLDIVMLIPITLVYSITGFDLAMNNLSTIVTGYMVKGNGNANLMSRVLGINSDSQADSYASDQKLAHYARIPPRAIFRCQMIATLLNCFITLGVVKFQMNSVQNFCTQTQTSHFTCAFTTTIYADTVLFGAIGPTRIFGVLYPALKYSFLIGFLIAIPFALIRRYYPKAFKYVHPVLLCNGAARWSNSYNLAYYTPGVYLSVIFMFFVRRRYLPWWSKYNYILTSALSTGVALSGVVIFLAVQYKPKPLIWWGNTVARAGLDGGDAASLLKVPKEGFGLPVGSF